MAVNESRSMNADLREGLTDGTVKKLAPNRGGVIEPSDGKARSVLHSELYDQSFEAAKGPMADRLTSLY